MCDLNDPELLKTGVDRVEAHVKLVWHDHPVGHRCVLAIVVLADKDNIIDLAKPEASNDPHK
jgi:hypothetical protein